MFVRLIPLLNIYDKIWRWHSHEGRNNTSMFSFQCYTIISIIVNVFFTGSCASGGTICPADNLHMRSLSAQVFCQSLITITLLTATKQGTRDKINPVLMVNAQKYNIVEYYYIYTFFLESVAGHHLPPLSLSLYFTSGWHGVEYSIGFFFCTACLTIGIDEQNVFNYRMKIHISSNE